VRFGYLPGDQEEAMRVFIAGVSGAIGRPLTRLLLARGHAVIGLIRDPAGEAALRAVGAEPVVADALDRDGLLRAVRGLTADAIIHELTSLRKPPLRPRGMQVTNRLRSEGTANLLLAADRLGARRVVTQSITLGSGYRAHGDRILTEDDPFAVPVGDMTDDTLAALKSAESQTFTAPEGIALRYGLLYGGDGPQIRPILAKRGLPVSSGGLLGWVHHRDAAAATVAALENGKPNQAYNIVDDRPATWEEVFTTMAASVGAPAPLHIPKWILRLIAPYAALVASGTSMRVSNAKAKRELGWQPEFSTFREGIAAMAAESRQAQGALQPAAARAPAPHRS
jgi:nucleoside-diphosphate-sugar epimerase